jgi:hypothetical protein
MRKYKPDYDEAFRDEQVKWFEERMEQLPQSLQVNQSTFSPDLRVTVRALITTVKSNKPDKVFSGYMELLMQIKDRLQEQGIE